jgi:uncharacterized protein (TIGR03118 family)
MTQTKNLISDLPGLAKNTNPDFVNSWGIDSGLLEGKSIVWVANNHTGIVNAVTSDAKVVKRITVPGPSPITGLAVNTLSKNFIIPGTLEAAEFLVASENGTVSGWNEKLGSSAVVVIDNSAKDAIYKGITIANDKVYVANFFSGFVEIYNGKFKSLGQFTDPALALVTPTDAPGFAPFNVYINDNKQVIVSFALQNDAKQDNVAGAGLGFIDIFDLNGKFIRRFYTGGVLNAPWGIADFNDKHTQLAIGNFGDGKINIFDLKTGKLISTLLGVNDEPIIIDGLWEILNKKTSLLFASGPAEENHGLYGKIKLC